MLSRRSVAVTALCALLAAATSAPSALAASMIPRPYFAAHFSAPQNSHTFGQDPSWTRSGDVLSQELDGSGILQVYHSRLNGSGRSCVTCDKTPGPNGFAAERPHGGWILFCSYGDQPEHFGMPCLGGYGGDLYAIRSNGTDTTRLTRSSDPGGGAVYTSTAGVPYDNYHVYWSPNGRQIVWTRQEAYPLSEGGARWQMMLADFVAPGHGRPHLAHIRVVGPAFGIYETQHWAPDGSGFLFTAFGPRRSPYQATPPGWMHQQLYFMRLYGHGASPAHPRVTQLSDDTPVYQEQAAFTSDMREVIFMSNRNASDGSWYDEVMAAAERTGFDAPDPGSTGTLQFLADFSDPRFRSDLFMLDVRTHDLRELTNFHNVVPEFNWNANSTRLIWSGIVGGRNHNFITRTAGFPGITASERRTPTRIPAPGLYGHPIDMARVKAAATPGSAFSTSLALPASVGTPVGTQGNDKQTIPPVVATYYALWLNQLDRLASLSGTDINNVSFLSP